MNLAYARYPRHGQGRKKVELTMADRESGRNGFETNPLMRSRIEQIEKHLRAWKAKPITIQFDPTGTNFFSMMELMHSYAKRCIDLAESIRSLLGDQRIIPATIVARALIETVAMGCLYLHEMDRLVDAGDRDRLYARFSRFYLGAKGEAVEPVHVMDGMRYLEKIDGDYVAHLDRKFGAFTCLLDELKKAGTEVEGATPREVLSAIKNYNLLSEVSHPNGTGTQFLYPDESNEDSVVAETRGRFRFLSLAAIWQCHHLLSALEKSADLPERFQASFVPSA